jgi:hypothetical protein
MLALLVHLGIKPGAITFADTGGERDKTYQHLERMQSILASMDWPEITICVTPTLDTTPYNDLYGNCVSNETLPSIAFGLSSCSIKWKQNAQDRYIKGVRQGTFKRPPMPIWQESTRRQSKILKLIGYDNSQRDKARAARAAKHISNEFDYCYPLQIVEWDRQQCLAVIGLIFGKNNVPRKSACFFCSASKKWELYDLAAEEPDKLELALALERRALTGKHSPYSDIDFATFTPDFVSNNRRFPSPNSCMGLGRNFSWNHWAISNDVVDDRGHVKRDTISRHRFASEARRLATVD